MANKRKTIITPEVPGGPGGQELPGNNFMDAICGALGALAYGDSAIKNQSDLMGAVGQQSKLYLILESLNKNNKGEDKNKLVSAETNTFMKDIGQVMRNNITDPINEQFLIMNENLLNTGNQIRDFIENYETVTDIFNNINNTLSCIEEGLINRENLPEVKIANEITGSNNLPELIKSFENIDCEELKNIYEKLNTALSVLNDIDLVKAEKSIKSINEILKSTLNIGAFLDKKDNTEKFKENIKNVINLFNNNEDSLRELFNSLRAIVGKNETTISNDIIILSELLGNLISIISMDQSKVSTRGIKILRNILRPSGPIDSIFKDLNRISKKEIPSSTKAIKDIFSIVSSFQDLGKIGFFAAINIRFGLGILSDFIKNDFRDIFNVISSIKETGEKEAKINIQSIINTIDLITKIGETKVNLRKVRRRIYEISDIICKSVIILFDNIKKLSIMTGGEAKNVDTIIKSIQSILSIITSLNDIKESVIENTGNKIDDIAELFKTSDDASESGEIHNLITNLSKLSDICENVDKNINKITDIFDSINILFDTIPGFAGLLKTSFKLELLSDNIKSINNMITGNEEEKIIGISNIKINDQKINKVITAVNNIIDFINSTNENLSEDVLNELIKKNTQIIKLLYIINEEFILTNSLEQLDENKLKTIEEFILNFSEQGSIGVAINAINNESLDNLNTLLEIIQSLSISLLYVNELKNLEIKEGDLDSVVEAIDQINIITNLITDSTSEDQVDKIKNKSAEICALCDIFKSIAAISTFGPMAKPGLTLLESSAEKINEIIGKFNEINIEKVNAAKEMMNAFAKLMIISAAVLIVGALAMTFIDVGNLMTFGITLGAFMFLLTKSISNLGKEITGSFNIIEDFTKLVVASALVLILGGLAMSIIDVGNLILFGTTLLGFIWALTIPFKSFAKNGKEAMHAMHDFTIFVVASAAVLVLGGLIMSIVDKVNLLVFTATLFAFITAMVLPFWLFNKFAKDAIKGMREFTIFVVATAAVLILGGLIMGIVDKVNLLIFTATLFAFITAMTLPFWLFNKFAKGAMKGMREFTILVVASATVLLLGSMLMNYIDKINLVVFATVLFGFIWGITKAVSKNTKGIKKSGPPLLMMIGVVGMAAAVLLLGSWAMGKIDPINIALFTVILAGFMLGMVGMLKIINKFKKDIFIGIAALGAMTLIVGLSAGVLMLVGKVMRENDLSSLLIGVGIIALVIVGIAGIAMGIGAIVNSGIGGAILWAGILTMGAIVGVAVMAGLALLAIGNAMKIMAEIGTFDASAMIENITALLSLGAALAPIGALAGLIIPASIAIMAMSTMMSEIAQAVKDYSELKIPLYEGTKVVGYRHLEKNDFESAAENIKLIVTTLGQAVIDVYNMKPEIFKSDKFTIVTESLTKLAPMISKIARAVNDYANLRVAISWDKDGKVNEYRHLSNSDFEAASENVKKVIITLAQAVVSVYNASPELFDDGDDSIFNVVMDSCKGLGKMLSKIANSVKSYANLTIPIEWDKDGKAVQFRTLTNNDFEGAGENIKKVITTLAQAVVSVYNASPDLFDDGDDSIFNIVMDSCKDLSKMLSKVADGIQSYADLTIPVEWNKDGKAVQFRTLTNNDFDAAGENIKKVITTLAQAVVSVYKASPDLFDDGDDSTFNIVMDSCKDLSKMLSKIADGVQSYANLTIPIEWNKDGKAIKFRSLKSTDFDAAGENVKKVITTLAKAVVSVYNASPDLFEDGEDSTFNIVMDSCKDLGEMLSEIAEGVQSYANLTIPVEWNKDGKAIKFRTLTKNDFTSAGENVKTVITTLAKAVVSVYKDSSDLFDDDEDSTFNVVLDSCNNLGKMLSEIAEGVQSYASLTIPVEWNKDGKAIKFRTLTKDDFTAAGENIKTVITTLAKAIINTYNENPDMFVEPSSKGIGGFLGKKEKSKMGKIMASIAGLGNLVADIGQGVREFATMQYACEWNDDGKPIKYVNVGDAEFKAASKNIGDVIKLIGQALINIYKDNPGGMFDDEVIQTGFIIKKAKKLEGTSPIAKTIKALGGMGELVASLAGGVKDFASMQYPDQWDDQGNPIHYIKISSDEQKAAAENIGHTITTVGNALIAVYQGKSWSDMIIARDYVVPMINNIAGSIGKIGFGIRLFSINQIPTWYDKDGKPMDPVTIDYEKAANTIGTVITIIGKELIKVNSGAYGWNIEQAINVSKSILNISKGIIPIALGLRMFAMGEIPLAYDKDGKPTKTYKIDFNKAAQTAGDVMGVLAKKIIDIYKGNKDSNHSLFMFSFTDFEKANNKVIPLLLNISKTISPIAQSLYFYGKSEVPIKWDKDGKPTETQNIDYVAAANTASMVLGLLPNSIITIAKSTNTQDLNEAMTNIPQILEKIRNILGPLANTLYIYGEQQVPIKYDKDGNPAEFKKVNFVLAGITAGLVMTSILNPIGAVISNYNWNLYDKRSEIMFNVLRTIIQESGNLAKAIYIYGIEQVPTKIDNEGNVIESKEVDFVKSGIVLGSVFETLATSMKNSIKLMNWDYYEEESESMFNGLNKYIANIGKLGNVLKWYSLRQIPLSVDKDGNPTRLIEFNPEMAAQTTTDIVIHLAKSFDKIIDNYSKTFEKMNELKLFDTLVNLVTKLLKTSQILSQVLPVNENTNMLLQALDGHIIMFDNIFSKNDVNEYNDWLIKSDIFNDIIKLLSGSYSYITKITEEPFNILAEGLDNINEKISNMPSQYIFGQHEQILSKYVKSINTIDIKKVNSLTNLINSMNILAFKMGNIDQLTKVLADQISTVLKKLTEQLAIAAQTIKDAEKLQKFRENSIRKSINEISDLLAQTMKVEISQSSNPTSTNTGNTTGVTETTSREPGEREGGHTTFTSEDKTSKTTRPPGSGNQQSQRNTNAYRNTNVTGKYIARRQSKGVYIIEKQN